MGLGGCNSTQESALAKRDFRNEEISELQQQWSRRLHSVLMGSEIMIGNTTQSCLADHSWGQVSFLFQQLVPRQVATQKNHIFAFPSIMFHGLVQTTPIVYSLYFIFSISLGCYQPASNRRDARGIAEMETEGNRCKDQGSRRERRATPKQH